MIGPGGMPSAVPEDVEGKVTSPLVKELRDSIRRNGYTYEMVMALIQPEIEIVIKTRFNRRANSYLGAGE